MHSNDIEAHFAHRWAKIEPMLASPENYKVCSQCLAVWLKWVSVCGFCASYRWLRSAEAVTTVASFMRTSPYPRNAGFVPWLPTQSVGETTESPARRGVDQAPEECLRADESKNRHATGGKNGNR